MQIQSIIPALIQKLIQGIVAKLEDNLAVQIQAAKDAHMAATHSESVAEGKYDTFGLESSYLAQGQQKRVEEVTVALHYFRQEQLKEQFQKELKLQSKPTTERQFIEPLCFIALLNDQQSLYFVLAMQAGGLKITLEDKVVTVITPESPIGKAMNEKMIGDEIDITLKGQLQTFEVMQIV
ncbi:MAG: GreA/GreB family elongation factor [Psychrosphaera sp.]|nr:GreA/GreB family elongation factor [Psychrosphaera sp.]